MLPPRQEITQLALAILLAATAWAAAAATASALGRLPTHRMDVDLTASTDMEDVSGLVLDGLGMLTQAHFAFADGAAEAVLVASQSRTPRRSLSR
jgi:hypothetical protein